MAKLHTLVTGLGLVESPRWHDSRLWFANWLAQEVLAVDLTGKQEVIAHVPSFPFCIDWLPDGRLLVVSGGEGRLLRREPDGSLVTHAEVRHLSRYPWNEIVVDGRGNIYLNCINFDFPAGAFTPGIVALVTPDGSVRQVADGVAFPNGMAVTPDNGTLIVAESYANRLTAFDIAADGSLSQRRVWAELGNDHPDGICLDAEGAIWYADVGTSRCVRIREGGEMLQEIALDRGCVACMLGGDDGRSLFMLAASFDPSSGSVGQGTGEVVMVEATAPGAGWPRMTGGICSAEEDVTMREATIDQRVDTYIESLPEWQQDIYRTVRSLVHAADPAVTETIKRTDRPYFVLQGNICPLQATKDHVNVFLYDPHVSDPEGVITSGHQNTTGRTVAIYQGEAVKGEALLAMFREIIAHNRAGGWRKIRSAE